MKISKQQFFQYAGLALMALVFYFGIIYLFRYFGFPSPEEIIAFTQKYYELYGYPVVFFGALAEGALFINWYLPGSIVVALGVIFAKQAGLNILLVLALVVLGFFLTALLNYALGRFGWYHIFLKLGLKGPLQKVQEKIEDKGLKILFTAYVHPNFGALAATTAGILRLPFLKFFTYSLISIIVWNSLWTALFYYFGSFLIHHVNLLVLVVGVFIYFMIVKSFKKDPADIPANIP